MISLHRWKSLLEVALKERGADAHRAILSGFTERLLRIRRGHPARRSQQGRTSTRLVPSSRPSFPAIGNWKCAQELPSDGTRLAMVRNAQTPPQRLGRTYLDVSIRAPTLYEIAFNHFFRGHTDFNFMGDMVYVQGTHAGVYARRLPRSPLDERHLQKFARKGTRRGGGSRRTRILFDARFLAIPPVSWASAPSCRLLRRDFNRYERLRHLKRRRAKKLGILRDGECDERNRSVSLTLAAARIV